MTGRFVLAFDVGTSGVKAVLANLRGRVVASRYHPYGLRALDGGRVEQDVGEIYGRLGAACRSLLDWRGVNPKHVEAVSVTAQMFNVVPVGAAGEPLAPMLSWLDTRATPQAAALAAAMDPDEQFRRLGATITAKDILPKILWLKERQPEVYARTSKLLDCKEVVVALLTGELVTDHAGASAYRLADLDAGGWDADACQAVGVSPALLPEVAAATDLAGGVTDAGATEHGDAHVSLGTAVYFGITLDRPATDPGRQLGVLGHMDPRRFILWLEIATGGGPWPGCCGCSARPARRSTTPRSTGWSPSAWTTRARCCSRPGCPGSGCRCSTTTPGPPSSAWICPTTRATCCAR
jgi:xylulokinase